MKHLIATAAFAVLAAGTVQADNAYGTWASPKNENGASIQVKIQDCGGTICGTIVKALGGADTTIVGKQMVWNMKPTGGGQYKGKIWAPDTDKTYNGKMTLSGNSMKMAGCILGICRGETFSRVN